MVLQYKRSENVVSRELGGQKVLIPIQQNGVDIQRIYALNDTAEAVWELLNHPRSFDDIVAKLADEFTASVDVIGNDLEKLLKEMVAEEIVKTLEGNQI